MENNIKKINVNLWGTRIGIAFWEDGIAYFEYDKNFVLSGIELSPIHMPLKKKAYSFPSLNRDTFKGLPGMIADSLPDKFGNQLIDQWLERTGKNKADFGPLDRLCYIGERGMGALEFTPTIGVKNEKTYSLQIEELVTLANEALSEKSSLDAKLNHEYSDQKKREAVEHIISVGTSAGGARAKAVIAWNETTNEIRSGQIPTEEGFTYWLLKFDGVSENRDKELLADPKGFGLLEYAYYLMAVDAGIDMSECRVFKENGRSHFMTKRFDRLNGGQKIFMQSLCGIAHFDFNSSGGYSYEQAIGVMRDLRLPPTTMLQFFRRMVFNVVSVNQDDHTKNISFLMDQQGTWFLSPAYDITYCNGEGWTKQHQMTINNKSSGFSLTDLLAVAFHADITKSKALKIIADVIGSVKQWKYFAQKSGLENYLEEEQSSSAWIDRIEKEHRLYFLD